MRPDDLLRGSGEDAGDTTLPIDADLQSLDAELDAAGVQARGMLHGRTQPTRFFSVDLRARLMGGYSAEAAAAPVALHALGSTGGPRGSRLRPELVAGEAWAPTPLAPRIKRRTPTILPRARWALLGAAALSGVLVAGALGAHVDWLFPVTPSPSAAPTSTALAIVAVETPLATAPVIEPVPSDGEATAAPTDGPKPTRTPRPEPTPTPRPTAPPVLDMNLLAKACPGGVLLDWSKPATGVAKYRVLRALGDGVPATYPAAGTTEIETARSSNAAVTDGFDASLGGGNAASYRAFAFNAGGQIVAMSESHGITTAGALQLGLPGVADNGDGHVTISWSNPGVPDGCFSYGKVVVSTENPEPSYLDGARVIGVVENAAATGTIAEVPSDLHGQTVWLRYQMIRVTSLGKLIVGSTDVAQVVLP